MQTQTDGDTGAVNESTGGVGTESKPAASSSTTKSTPKADKDGKLDMLMLAPPSEQEGLAAIWRIAYQAENGKVNDAVVGLLIQVHTNLAASLESRIAEFEDVFITGCIDIITQNLALIEARSPLAKEAAAKATTLTDKKKLRVFEKRITLAMKAIKKLIQNSEKDGTYGLTQHLSLA